MDGLFGEVSQAAKAMNMGDMGGAQTGFNPYASEQAGADGEQKRPSAEYSDAELMQIYENIQSGNCPPEMKQLFNQMAAKQASEKSGPGGKPYVDEEGGTVIQPGKGFVIKTKNVNTGEKMFLNMCQHDIVDPFEEKAVPMDQQAEHGAAEKGLRIPLSLGDIREESDKKGEPAQVIDIIWAPATIEKAKKDATFRQVVVELAFNYIFQKHQIELDLRYIVPKLNYKGATVQYQRIRAKKTPKIQEVELTQEQKEAMERQHLEEQKIKDAMSEKKPTWNLYYGLGESQDVLMEKDYWLKTFEDHFEQKVGDADERWNELRENFKLGEELDVFEEFDGINHEGSKYMVLVVSLPLLVRGNGVHMRILDDIFSLRVHNLYKLQLSLPIAVEHEDCLSFFDCKLRRMFIVAPVQEPKCQEIFEDEAPVHSLSHYVRSDEPKVSDKKTSEQVEDSNPPEPVVSTASAADDLLFDVV